MDIAIKEKYSKNILEVKTILDLLYESTFGSVDINYTKIIFLIRNKVNLLSKRNEDYIRESELIDLSIATKILLNEFKGLDYLIEVQINKCLQNFNEALNKHNQFINAMVIKKFANNCAVNSLGQRDHINNRQYISR